MVDIGRGGGRVRPEGSRGLRGTTSQPWHGQTGATASWRHHNDTALCCRAQEHMPELLGQLSPFHRPPRPPSLPPLPPTVPFGACATAGRGGLVPRHNVGPCRVAECMCVLTVMPYPSCTACNTSSYKAGFRRYVFCGGRAGGGAHAFEGWRGRGGVAAQDRRACPQRRRQGEPGRARRGWSGQQGGLSMAGGSVTTHPCSSRHTGVRPTTAAVLSASFASVLLSMAIESASSAAAAARGSMPWP